jgi:2-methylcitrate dehydratase PrpD
VLNPVIDACLELAARPDFSARGLAAITRIELTGPVLLRERTDRPGVTNGRQSQVSAQHAVAVVLARRRAGLAEFSDAAVADPAVCALGGKLVFIDDTTMRVDAARVRVTFDGGAVFESRIDAARGSLANALTDAELETKLRTLCAYGQSGVDAERLIGALWALEPMDDVGGIMQFAVP